MEKTENIMETMGIPKLILKISIPMMLSSPVQILVAALGCGIAVGLNSVISRALGEKNEEAVKRTATAAMWLAMAAYILIVIMCVFFIQPYFRWQSGGNTVIAEHGIRYLGICMLLSFGQMTQWVFDRLPGQLQGFSSTENTIEKFHFAFL